MLITDTLSLNVVVFLAGDLRPGHGNTDAAERSYSALAALVRLEGRMIPHTKRPRLVGLQGAGPLAAGVLNKHLRQVFPPQ